MKFRTAYTRDRSTCPSGSRYRKTYTRGADGELKEAGVEDVFDSIQKAGEGLALADLIRRAERGDQTAIGTPIDSYGDLTNLPTDLLDAHMKLSAARDSYNSLPANVKALFNNDFQTMLTAIGDGSVVDKLSQLAKAASPAPQTVTNTSDGGSSNA
jgi:hypothetical protein